MKMYIKTSASAIVISVNICGVVVKYLTVVLFAVFIFVQGYAAAMDDPGLIYLIPPSLENKKEVLFGNLTEIYEFHQK